MDIKGQCTTRSSVFNSRGPVTWISKGNAPQGHQYLIAGVPEQGYQQAMQHKVIENHTNDEWLWVRWYRYFHELKDEMLYSNWKEHFIFHRMKISVQYYGMNEKHSLFGSYNIKNIYYLSLTILNWNILENVSSVLIPPYQVKGHRSALLECCTVLLNADITCVQFLFYLISFDSSNQMTRIYIVVSWILISYIWCSCICCDIFSYLNSFVIYILIYYFIYFHKLWNKVSYLLWYILMSDVIHFLFVAHRAVSCMHGTPAGERLLHREFESWRGGHTGHPTWGHIACGPSNRALMEVPG